jgi:type I site-specific restriction endonuclease
MMQVGNEHVSINESEAEILIEEHLRERGWSLTDLSVTRKRWREHLDGEEADRVFFYDGRLVAILEAKRPGKDLWAALESLLSSGLSALFGERSF